MQRASGRIIIMPTVVAAALTSIKGLQRNSGPE